MTTKTKTHEVVVTQRYSERHAGDSHGATLHSGVFTSQVVGKEGIDRQLRLEVMQAAKVKGSPPVIIRRILSWEEVEEFSSAANTLAKTAQEWRSTPDPRRSSIEFNANVGDGFAIGRRNGNQGPEFFLALRDENNSARFVLGGLEKLSEFVAYLSDAAMQIR